MTYTNKIVNGVVVSLTTAEIADLQAQEAAWGPSAAEILDAAFASDVDRQALVAAVAGATPTQIKNYINNNVIDLASARLMLIRLTLLVARLTKN